MKSISTQPQLFDLGENRGIAALIPEKPKFNGSDYIPEMDDKRLTSQYDRIFNLMKDGVWRTLREIEKVTRASQSSISAQMRHMRKPRFGSHTINKRARGNRENGLFEYQLIVNKEAK